jgi:hypothetical protein
MRREPRLLLRPRRPGEWKHCPEDDLSLLQSWSKDLFDIGQEVGSIHRAIQHKRGRDAIIAQPAYKSRCFPVAVWHLINEPFALRSPAIEAGHLGGGGGLIDEDKLFRIKDFLFFPERLTGRSDVGPSKKGGKNFPLIALPYSEAHRPAVRHGQLVT